ncbi:MAG: hypothetical protein P8J87_12000, partial [Verrucomicrobiales bacterium]|nr:hypothetical protein [Verrucomicrobiales bacterium]
MMINPLRAWLKRLSSLYGCRIAVSVATLSTLSIAHAQFENLALLTEASSDVSVRNATIAFDTANSKIRWQKSGNAPIAAEIDSTQIFADVIEYDVDRELLIARGGVAIYKDGLIYRGENIRYDLRNEEISAKALRTSKEPIYLDAGDFESATEEIKVITTKDSYFTTHDSVNPNFRIKAKQVDVYPEDRIVFHNLTAYAGSIPVFYFPYLSQPMDEELGYTFNPGWTSDWGAYLLNRYGTLVGDHTIVKINVDLRSERGIAGGFELLSRRHRENDNYGHFQFYGTSDSSPDTGKRGDRGDRIPGSSRYRLNLQHRVYLPGPEESSFYVDIDLNKVSDEFFYEDFFPNEFRIDPRPDNLINIVKSSPRGTLSLLGRFRLNDFFQTDTRLPELAVDFTRQPVFNTALFYEGTTSVGIYTEELAEPDQQRSQNRITVLKDRLKRFRSDREAFLGINPA